MFMDCSFIIYFDTLKVYMIVVKDSCILMLPRGLSCYLWRLLRICYFILPFQLLFALYYLA